MTRYFIHRLLILILFFTYTKNIVSAEEKYIERAIMSPLVASSLLLDADETDGLSVIVGERGHILYSTDSKNWMQASVDTRVTLTAIDLIDNKLGWAVGHDAVIMRTKDGAKSWKKVFSAIDEEAPLLDVIFHDALNGIAIGAYGLIYLTKDGGTSWKRSKLKLKNDTQRFSDGHDELNDIYDLHLNNISSAGQERFYIAAEAGHIFRSDDNTKSWLNLSFPYHGSLFGLLALSYEEVLVYGLRGNLYRSYDAGISWEKIETYTQETLTAATILNDGDIAVAGMGGTLLISKDKGITFSRIDLVHRYDLSSIVETASGDILLSSDAGYEIISRAKLNISSGR